ncbi:MAG: AraC family transcriptional regulator [Proteobacteria bacterium]|nr:AraC family transcriptional regulator [Pseudomonadota bacterium]
MSPLDLRDRAVLTRPVVRARYCQHLVDLLAEEGVAPEAVLASTRLAPADLAKPEARISYAQQFRIYENALAQSREPALGFRLGRRERISDHGVFGYAIQSSADLAQAIRVIERYVTTVGPLLDLGFERSGDAAAITLSEVAPLGPIARMAREESLLVLVRSLLALTDPATRPLEVRVDLPPNDRPRWERELGCPVRFDAPRTEIRLRPADLSRPLAFSDEETAAVCERRCAELLQRLGTPGGIVEELRRVLVGDPGRFPSLEEAARELAMSGRTLRRRLQEASTTFQAVLEDVRKGLALDYLQRSNLSVDEIASLLGYSETPNFYRAFKRWTGRTPAAFR